MRSSIRFAHANVNSLREHFSDVKNLMVNKDVDVFALKRGLLQTSLAINIALTSIPFILFEMTKLAAFNKKSFRLRRH